MAEKHKVKNWMIRALLSVALASLALLSFNPSDRSLAQQQGEEKPIWSGQSGGFKIQWTTADLAARRANSPAQTVFSAKSDTEREWKRIQKDIEVREYEYNRTMTLLSVVGSIISFDDSSYCDCGGAHPSSYAQYKAVDLARPGGAGDEEPVKRVKLSDLFPESEILKALLADPIIKKALQISKKPEPRTLAKLIEDIAYEDIELEDCGYSVSEDQLTRFAFHHVEGNRVAIRLSLSHAYETCRGRMTQIGILLPIPAALKQPLTLAASGKAGFLMQDQKKIAGDQMTSFGFSTYKNQ